MTAQYMLLIRDNAIIHDEVRTVRVQSYISYSINCTFLHSGIKNMISNASTDFTVSLLLIIPINTTFDIGVIAIK